jgi:hypothetical protein
VYVEVPPLNDVAVLSVELPLLLTEVGSALITGAVNVGFTVTLLPAEQAVEGVLALSVTL